MDRRGFLKGLLASSAAVVAAEFGVPEYLGHEIKAELVKTPDSYDYLKSHLRGPEVAVGYSDIEIFDNRPVWVSTGQMTQFWADEAAKTLGRRVDDNILAASRAMVSEMDRRLRKAEATEDDKVLIEVPRFANVRHNYRTGQMELDMECGVEEVDGLFGQKNIRVGYLEPDKSSIKILDANGREIIV